MGLILNTAMNMNSCLNKVNAECDRRLQEFTLSLSHCADNCVGDVCVGEDRYSKCLCSRPT